MKSLILVIVATLLASPGCIASEYIILRNKRAEPCEFQVVGMKGVERIVLPQFGAIVLKLKSEARVALIAEGATNSTNMKYAAVEVNDSYSPSLGGSDLESVVDLPVVTGENGGVVKIMVAGKVVTEGL